MKLSYYSMAEIYYKMCKQDDIGYTNIDDYLNNIKGFKQLNEKVRMCISIYIKYNLYCPEVNVTSYELTKQMLRRESVYVIN